MILAGDIGGTNTRLAYFEAGGARPSPAVLEVFPSANHKGLEEIVAKFVARYTHPVEAAAFGIAGPVQNGISRTPNLPWLVDASSLAHSLGLASVNLINDLEANAHGIAVLGPDDFTVLSEGASGASGNRVLISAGTGLGEAGLLAEGNTYRPYASEGGHADFAARNETELELLRYLLQRFQHVSYERVLSGPGLHNIYQFFRDTGRADEPSWLAGEMGRGDPSAAITEHALKRTCPICVLALDQFVAIYGAEAGNLALRGLATGGVYVGGGIAPKILTKLQEPGFLQAFRTKGRVSTLLEAMPVRVIMNDKTALLGAARVAMISRAQSRLAGAE